MTRKTARRAITALVAVGAVVLVVVSNPRDSDSRCVGGRAAVQTLSDGDDVNFAPVPARVERLGLLERPGRVGAAQRSTPVEATTFKITARLVSMRRRSNDEVDVIVSAPTRRAATMSVGFEGSRTCGHRAVARGEAPMKEAQQALIAACGNPTRRSTPLAGTAEITGVGFFGHRREEGVAPNGVELHPVLRFESSECRRRR